MTDKMTAEQALDEFIAAATSPIYRANYEESEKWAEVIRQALSAPSVPVAQDQQVIADLRAEVEALKAKWQRLALMLLMLLPMNTRRKPVSCCSKSPVGNQSLEHGCAACPRNCARRQPACAKGVSDGEKD